MVVPDLRGYGESTLEGPFTFEAAVDDVVALLDVLDADRVAIVGLSLGGNIAQEIVYRFPDRVDALVVADATCKTAPRSPVEVPLTTGYLAASTLTSRGRYQHRAATARDENVRQYVRAVDEERPVRDILQILLSLVNDALHPDPEYRLSVPTLLIQGEFDRIGDIAGGTAAWAAREPIARYVVVPDAGHANNQDNPEAFTAALAAFLDDVLPAAPQGPPVPAPSRPPFRPRTRAAPVAAGLIVGEGLPAASPAKTRPGSEFGNRHGSNGQVSTSLAVRLLDIADLPFEPSLSLRLARPEPLCLTRTADTARRACCLCDCPTGRRSPAYVCK